MEWVLILIIAGIVGAIDGWSFLEWGAGLLAEVPSEWVRVGAVSGIQGAVLGMMFGRRHEDGDWYGLAREDRRMIARAVRHGEAVADGRLVARAGQRARWVVARGKNRYAAVVLGLSMSGFIVFTGLVVIKGNDALLIAVFSCVFMIYASLYELLRYPCKAAQRSLVVNSSPAATSRPGP